MGNIGIADRWLPRTHTMQEIARVTITVIEMLFVGLKRFAHNIRWIGHKRAAVHGDPALGPNKTSPSLAANRLAWIRLSIKHHSTGIPVPRAIVSQENLDRPGVIRVGSPLDNIVVMLAPVQFADVKRMRADISIERDLGSRAQV